MTGLTKHRKLATYAILAVIAMIVVPINYYSFKYAVRLVLPSPAVEEQREDPTPPAPQLTHRQEVWLNVLEWCESRGNPNAINEIDRDGTASYGAFQFKPTTLDYFADKYGITTTTLMDYATQKAVVTQMILHRDDINWHQQFPDCVKKFGVPPTK